ncbi:MAG TPA: substrate-binding domain-containing protein [Sphingomicrobium sp.]|nr:substrate-binding domain-containing protein [Sphingomicrobium sp.]
MSAAIILAALASSPAAQPQTIRIWGPPAMAAIVQHWAETYRATHPEMSFELVMKGSDTAVPGLYSVRADIGLMGRLNDEVDDNGFSRPLGYPLTRIAITSGSLTSPGKSDAVALLVPRANPVSGINLRDLGRILDCGADAAKIPYRTWGDLGVKGRWANKPIHIYTYDMGSRTGAFIQHAATAGRRRMCWERITEFADTRRLDGTLENSADRIGAAARRDPFALAIANPEQAVGGLRLVAVSRDRDQPFILPNEGSVTDGSYPLARQTYAFIRHKPGSPIDPKVRSFLEYVLSPAGQSLLAADRGYLPLDPKIAVSSRAALETP